MDAGQRSTPAAAKPLAPSGTPDADSQRWLDALGGEDRERTAALSELHLLLLGAARHEISRRRAMMPHLRGDVEQAELLEALRSAIDEVLSEHQREVLIALALNGVPIDVLAERLHTTRGALYKTLHDARKKLRKRLADQGLDITATEAKEVR